MAKVIMTGTKPTKPFFGVSRGSIILMRRPPGSGPRLATVKKEMSEADKQALESFRLHRAEEARRALSGEQE